MPIELIAIPALPLIEPGDDLPGLLLSCASAAGIEFRNGDVLVVAQKIVSKAEDRFVYLPDVVPSAEAIAIAQKTGKDPQLVEVILQESDEIIRARPGLIITEHRRGFISANAGVDHSNVRGNDQWVLLLPEDPDASAERIRSTIKIATGADLAVIVSDSHGRAWRLGTVGIAIGVAGMRPLTDLRGEADLTGRALQATLVGTADELAAAASLLMGQASEGNPAVLIRGAEYTPGQGSLQELIRPKETDQFR
ncbi:MAG: coenzyme F420-0:L-glutamate ligase [Chloroflexota bacterium]|nr:coenzyme F420-0:L-glutamate ligase [Chloroflexota bacterium]